jgi:Protein of unknown function (DUF3606)
MHNLTKPEVRDRTKINVQSAFEIKCWAHELNITRSEFRELVEKVANSAAAVRKELASRQQDHKWWADVRRRTRVGRLQ